MFRNSASKLMNAALSASRRSLTSKSKSNKKKSNNSKSLDISKKPVLVETNPCPPCEEIAKIEEVAEVKLSPCEEIMKMEAEKEVEKAASTPCAERKFSPCAERPPKSNNHQEEQHHHPHEQEQKPGDSDHGSLVPPADVLSKLKSFELSSKCSGFHIKSCGHESCRE
jgi:hypothetical protein